MTSRINGDASRDTAHIHPSEVAKSDWCPRETYFRMTNEPVTDPQANPSFQMESIFEEGHEIHRKWQGWLWEMGVLFGWWLCLACNHEWEDLAPRRCPSCNTHRDGIAYLEVPIEVPEYLLLGHSDGAVHDAKGRVLLEIKSVGVGTLRFEAPELYEKHMAGMDLKEVWKRINRPFASHLIQGLLYLWALPEYDAIIFIYEFKPNQSVKEFVVRRSSIGLVADHLSACKDIVRGVRSGFPPYRPVWATDAAGPKCRSCPYRSVCWGTEQVDADQAKAGSATERQPLRVRKPEGSGALEVRRIAAPRASG